MNDMFSTLLPAVLGLVTLITTIFLKYKIDIKTSIKEEKEIEKEVTRYVNIIDNSEKDVLALMIKNVAELREYYVINKQQARNSFSAALFISVLGFIRRIQVVNATILLNT